MFDKFDINKFYIGEIYLSSDFKRYNYVGYNKIIETLKNNGSISFSAYDTYFEDTDKYYNYRFLSVFFNGRDGCISLLDGREYESKGDRVYANLQPLSSLLPTVDYDIPTEISAVQAVNFYKILLGNQSKSEQFRNKLLNKPIMSSDLYYERPRPIDDFLVANLNLYKGRGKTHESITHIKYDNKIQESILEKNGVFSDSGYSKSPSINCSLRNSDHWSVYNTIFLNQKGSLYSILNFQTYENGLRTNIDVPDSFCERVVPLKESLEKKEIKIKEKTLTIPNAVKLFKSLK